MSTDGHFFKNETREFKTTLNLQNDRISSLLMYYFTKSKAEKNLNKKSFKSVFGNNRLARLSIILNL